MERVTDMCSGAKLKFQSRGFSEVRGARKFYRSPAPLK